MNDERQRVERAGGRARRARLTPAPGTDPMPEAPVPGRDASADDEDAGRATSARPEDERLRREKPPHWG
ncbi:hypothetical protein [Agromyces aureus]|uniref:hypothetical protein n=1 Tax=Agromyces aureus TaxID=453304 RepID=UPI000942B25C|nr:hypothetical protein [Agromyces aureus]